MCRCAVWVFMLVWGKTGPAILDLLSCEAALCAPVLLSGEARWWKCPLPFFLPSGGLIYMPCQGV